MCACVFDIGMGLNEVIQPLTNISRRVPFEHVISCVLMEILQLGKGGILVMWKTVLECREYGEVGMV